MPIGSRFPSAITRDQSSGDAADSPVRRRGPTASQVAMMTAAQFKAHCQRTGQWQDAERELIANMQNPDEREDPTRCPNNRKR
jgi:hypothetical protein